MLDDIVHEDHLTQPLVEESWAALCCQRGHRHPPAVVDAADDIFKRNPNIVVEHRGVVRPAVDAPNGPDLDTGQMHVHDDPGQPAMALGLGIGAYEQLTEVGVLGVGRPDLRAADHELVAVDYALAAKRGEIGARVRLGEVLAPWRLAAEDPR